MDWDDVRYFLSLARLGSVRAAGSALGVSHSTVARRVEALETRLSARLFDRNRDGYALTEAGRRMLPKAERVEAELSDLERELVGRDARLAGPVHVTCCDGFVSSLLMPRLAALCTRYPDIALGVTTDSRPFDLSRREADIAIRILGRGTQPPEHLIGRRIAPIAIASYIGRDHAARLDPERGGTLTRWLGYDEPRSQRPLIAQSAYPGLPLWGSFSSVRLAVQAARAGLGAAMIPCYAADPDPTLTRLVKDDCTHVAELWVLSHPDLRDNARFRAARTCIADALGEHAPLFGGQAVHRCAPPS